MTNGDRLVARLVLDAVADDPAVAVAGRQVGLGHAVDQLLAQAAILDQRLDRDDRQAVLAGDRVQLLAAGHADAVGDLAEHARPASGRPAGPGRRPPRCARRGGARPPPWPPAGTGGRAGPGRPASSPGR